jgi:hypothetical protein
MLGRVKVLCGVLVFRGVAAADMAAGETQSELHPTVAYLEALFAAFGMRLHGVNLVEMSASFGHVYLRENQTAG